MKKNSLIKANNLQPNMMALLFAAAYMVSYITRINFGAIISAMESQTGLSKSLLSLSLTGSFVAYGAGQILSGLCGDRFSPKKLISYGLTVTTLMNVCLSFCKSPYVMLAVWCVNGLAQSFIWPPMVRLMTGLFSAEDYKKVVVKVSWGSSIGTILVYLISPLLLSLWDWRTVFRACAACGIIMVLLWCLFAEDVVPRKVWNEEKVPNRLQNTLFTPLMLGVMGAIVLMGMLRDGVTTWMPSYISETYQMSNVISIMSAVVLPIFAIISFQITSRLYRRYLRNPLLCAGVIFGAGMLASLLLLLLSGKTPVFSVLLFALLTGSMHGVNLILICMIPPFFQKYGMVSTASGVLNSCTYIGSALSTYVVALLSEKLGWNFTLLTWVIIALFGTAVCLVNIRSWKRQFPHLSATKPVSDEKTPVVSEKK